MKRLFGILICAFLLATLCVLSASAKIITGDCGDYSTYSFDTETGEMVISGSGDMWEFGMEERPWYGYLQNIKKVVVEEGITSIEKAREYYLMGQLYQATGDNQRAYKYFGKTI